MPPLGVNHLDHQLRAMHPPFKVETALEFAGNAENEEVTEVGISLDTFEDADAEPCRQFFVSAIQVSISREEAVFGETDCAEWNGAPRRYF